MDIYGNEMTEAEFLAEALVAENCFAHGNDMLGALAAERCRQYISELVRLEKETNQPNSRIKELDARLPRGYQRIAHA